MSCKTLQGMYAEKLEKENKELKERIDKAIEYIHNAIYKRDEIFGIELLEILGDKE